MTFMSLTTSTNSGNFSRADGPVVGGVNCIDWAPLGGEVIKIRLPSAIDAAKARRWFALIRFVSNVANRPFRYMRGAGSTFQVVENHSRTGASSPQLDAIEWTEYSEPDAVG